MEILKGHGDKTYKVVNGTAYDHRTPDDLVTLLESIRSLRLRVRLIYGDVETGQTWGEAYPERGAIGRSGGIIKAPLLIKTVRSWGGEVILDHLILQVRQSPGGRVLWTHPKYNDVNVKQEEP